MAKKKKLPARTPKRHLNLGRYVDFEEEAMNFDLPVERVSEIAREVETSGGPVFEISITKSESELRERLEAIYSIEVKKFQTCPFPGCQEEFIDIHQFVAHERMHLIMESPDFRVRASVLRDIERTLVPTVESRLGIEGALTPAERAKLVRELDGRGLLPAGLEDGSGEGQKTH